MLKNELLKQLKQLLAEVKLNKDRQCEIGKVKNVLDIEGDQLWKRNNELRQQIELVQKQIAEILANEATNDLP